MIELPLVFLGGLLGSAHCVGHVWRVCPLDRHRLARRSRPISAGNWSTRPAGSSLIRFFGVVAGYMGLWLASRAHWWINAQAALSVTAGVLLAGSGAAGAGLSAAALLAQGCSPADRSVWPARLSANFSRRRACRTCSLPESSPASSPAAWSTVFWLSPSSSANIWDGLLTMSLFGAGTAPLMILAGTGSSLVSHAARRNLLRISAVCVGLTGVISIVRGILFVQTTAAPEVVRCLLCGTS